MRASCTFEPQADQVAQARRFVAQCLRGWNLDAPDATLLVSELATNAVLHARSEFSVEVEAAADSIRVEVHDGNSRLPTFSAVKPDAYSGRGLMLVQTLSISWGVDAHGDEGKTIWFEVAAKPAA